MRASVSRARITVLGWALLLTAAAPAPGQEAPLALRLPASARALALGDLFPVGQASPDAVFYAPAFAQGLRGIGAGLQWFEESSVLLTASGGQEWLGGAVGIGVRALSYAADDLSPRRPHLFGGGTVPVSERSVGLTYARRVFGVEVGATAKWVEQRIAEGSDDGAAFDLAAGKGLGPVRVQLAAFDVGPDLALGSLGVPLPTRVGFTAAATRPKPVGPLDVMPVLGITWEDGEDLAPAAGLEVAYWPLVGRTFFARGGIRRAPEGARAFTLGGGFAGDVIVLDYAYEPHESGRAAHRIGVAFR